MATREPDICIATSQAKLAQVLGISVQAVANWASRGMPGKPGKYRIPEVIAWARKDGPWRTKPLPESDDPLLADGDSPGLERYRLAKAALAELELSERTASLMSREKARGMLLRWAAIIRRMGEQLGRRHGPDAALAVNHALAECQYVVDHELGDSEFADDSATG